VVCFDSCAVLLPVASQKSRLKVLIVLIAGLIGMATVLYANLLVAKLAAREQAAIDLYAKAQQFIITSEGDNTGFILDQIINANTTVPIIFTDDHDQVIDSKNVELDANLSPPRRAKRLREELALMKEQHPPIVVAGEGFRNYIYYRNSDLLVQLERFPYVQLTVIACFVVLSYLVFSSARRAEQNRVWVGLAKETAHQLGTPLSSLMAWQEYLRASDKFQDEPIVEELGKDIRRLEIITERFSNIGSVPTLRSEPIGPVTRTALAYLETRVSRKVKFHIEQHFADATTVGLNIPLFEWVIENLTKNAVDAMEGRGTLTITMRALPRQQVVAIDITDTGKGIPKNKLTDVFTPGYTTKKRGWGLGLALAKRIIDGYHNGKLTVLQSEVGKGTTFRLVIPADQLVAGGDLVEEA
jgi:two-component system, sporulation sensor kinase E